MVWNGLRKIKVFLKFFGFVLINWSLFLKFMQSFLNVGLSILENIVKEISLICLYGRLDFVVFCEKCKKLLRLENWEVWKEVSCIEFLSLS